MNLRIILDGTESRKAYIYRTNFAKLFRGSQDGKQENLPAVLLLTFIFTLAFRVYIEFGIILDDVYNLFFIGLSTFFLCNSRNLSVVYVWSSALYWINIALISANGIMYLIYVV